MCRMTSLSSATARAKAAAAYVELVPAAVEVEAEFAQLAAEFPPAAWKEVNGGLEFQARTRESCVLTYNNTTVDFGHFLIRFRVTRVDRYVAYACWAKALTPRKLGDGDVAVHPHVYYRRDAPAGWLSPCKGYGERPIEAAALAARPLDAVALVDALLHTHNPPGYRPLQDWLGHTCRNCGATHARAVRVCQCGVDACRECGRPTTAYCRCGHYYGGTMRHYECSFVCLHCGKEN